MNRAWLAWVDPAAVPARVTVEARLLEGLAVEMTCVAVRSRP
jgi:enamine deaminase RidA (YjgF/YER057c/UK114 family)